MNSLAFSLINLVVSTGERKVRQEKKIIQALRESKSKRDIRLICEALSLAGTIFAVPTLMAKLKNNLDEGLAQSITDALAGIKSRTQYDELGLCQSEEFYDRFFHPTFWQPKWVGSLEAFVSFCYIIALGVHPDNEDSIISTGNFLMNEFQVNSAFDSFEAMKVCVENPEKLKKRLLSIADDTSADIMMMDEFANHPSIAIENSFDEIITSMKNDFLLNRMNLAKDFDLHLYLFNKASKLNQVNAG